MNRKILCAMLVVLTLLVGFYLTYLASPLYKHNNQQVLGGYLKYKRVLLLSATLFFIMFISSIDNSVYALSAPYPTIILIVEDAPRNISISPQSEEIRYCKRRDVLWAKYYTFSTSEYGEEALIDIATEEQTLSIRIDGVFLSSPLSYATLNFRTQTIIQGRSTMHKFRCILLAVATIIIVESALFYSFKYRKITSWIAFILLSVFTNSLAAAFVYSTVPDLFFMLFARIVAEIFRFLLKLLGSMITIHEYESIKHLKYVAIIDIVESVLAILLLFILPI